MDNSKAIKEAGLEASLQISSWAAVVTLQTAMNTLAATSATNFNPPGAYGWGYMHAPQMVFKHDVCGSNSSIDKDYWYECDANGAAYTCFPVDWNKWTSYGSGKTADTYSAADAWDKPDVPAFNQIGANSWGLYGFEGSKNYRAPGSPKRALPADTYGGYF